MLENLVTIPAFLFALGLIVFIHEGGHYLAAKLFGVQVKVFSLGFGQPLWRFERGGTDYRVSWIPLGGYVRMAGELPEERSGRDDDFLSKPRWQRILVYLAGPVMNIVLAILLVAGVFMHGIEIQAIQEIPAVVGEIEEGSAAAAAGLEVGDRVVTVAGDPVDRWKDVAFELSVSPERPVELTVERRGTLLDLVVVPDRVPRYEYGDAGVYPRFDIQLRLVEILVDTPADRAGFRPGDEVLAVDGVEGVDLEGFVDYVSSRPGETLAITVRRGGEPRILEVVPEESEGRGLIGVRLGYLRPLPLGEALVESVRFNLDVVEKTGLILGRLLTNRLEAKATLSGPIEIAVQSGQAARRGFDHLIFFAGFLSISIALMNLLPIPILDGGHITILLVESVLRRDLSLALKERITQLGFVLLLTLMAMVIFFDLSKNLPGLLGS